MKHEYKLTKKAYKLYTCMIEDGYCYSDTYIYAETRNKARYKIFKEVQYYKMKTIYGSNITYSNIPVVRCPELDLYDFEGEELTMNGIVCEIDRKERLIELDKMMGDDSIKWCYIMKHGSYYAPNHCGYVSRKINAGVYEKSDAISSAKSCDELRAIPINIEEHNSKLQEKIEDLKSRLINV